jgi:hypothetical protein
MRGAENQLAQYGALSMVVRVERAVGRKPADERAEVVLRM